MNKKLIIGILVVIAFGIGGVKIWTYSSGGNAKEKQVATNSSNRESSNNDRDTNKEESSQSNNSESNKSNNSLSSNLSQDEDTENTNDGVFNNKDNKNENSSSNNASNTSINTPYNVSVTGMRISKIGGFSGTFVEDGSNKKVNNILALEVKNTSKKDLQYGEIKLKVNGKETAVFKLTNLPAGKTATVIELTGSVPYNSGDNYKYEDATYAAVEKLPMSSKKVKVSTEGSDITIKNISGKDLGTVYVYYKNTKGSSYLGGITYRAKFEDVKKDKSYTANTSHFSKSNSEIVMVDTEN